MDLYTPCTHVHPGSPRTILISSLYHLTFKGITQLPWRHSQMTRLHVVKTAQIKIACACSLTQEMGVYGGEGGVRASSRNLPKKPAYFHFNQYKEKYPKLFRRSPIPSFLLHDPFPHRDSSDYLTPTSVSFQPRKQMVSILRLMIFLF